MWCAESVTGAIDILDLLASNAEPIGVREIARRLALAPSNVQRLIKTLTKAGFLEQTQETLRYRIGYRAFQVGSAFVGQNSLYSAVMPELYALASSADFAMVAEGTDFRYAGIEAGKAFFKITVHGAPQKPAGSTLATTPTCASIFPRPPWRVWSCNRCE